MDKENHKISVRIGGMSYNLVSSESESYTRQIAARADEMIRRVAMSSPMLSQQMTIILALTNAVDELTRQALQQSLAEQQRNTAETKAAELRTELAKARELNWEMKKELLRLNALCHQQELRLNDLENQAPVVLPVVNGERIPSKVVESTIEAEPIPEPEPASGSEPMIEPESAVALEPEVESGPAIEPESAVELEPAIETDPTVEPESAVELEEFTDTRPEMTATLHPAGIPVLTGKRPLKTIGELRQTGLEEYLSMYDQPKHTPPALEPQNSTTMETNEDDES